METRYYYIISCICLGVGLRTIVSMHSYSGAGKPPMYGDYEAQRHWQEITLNLRPADWYRNSTQNDLQYWGLDYPPLTAYHSFALGKLARQINPAFVELNSSRGFESAEHKFYMRLTVLLADLAIYIPAILCLGFALETQFKNVLLPFVLVALTYPGQILIDNGHFQYNNISLGFAAIAIAAIIRKRHYTAAAFFTLALNYKQMELYHALPFFAYLLRMCYNRKTVLGKLKMLLLVAAVVISLFLLLWAPWLSSLSASLSVIKRLFPLGRGVFEDKVSNVWCALNVLIKLKNLFTNEQMALICLCATLLFVAPINIHLFVKATVNTFLYALANSALAFFLFSFQVHEKSILLAALPAFCLLPNHSRLVCWFLEVSTFNMLPLLVKDGQALPYFALWYLFYLLHSFANKSIGGALPKRTLFSVETLMAASRLTMLALSLCSIFVPPPARYEYLWPLLISLFSCAHFIVFLLGGIYYQVTNLKLVAKQQ